MKKIYIINKECRNIGKEDGDDYNGEYGNTPEKIAELIKKGVIREEVEYDCDICEDTGEVSAMESVYAGEPHQAPIGVQKCECQLHEDDSRED